MQYITVRFDPYALGRPYTPDSFGQVDISVDSLRGIAEVLKTAEEAGSAPCGVLLNQLEMVLDGWRVT